MMPLSGLMAGRLIKEIPLVGDFNPKQIFVLKLFGHHH